MPRSRPEWMTSERELRKQRLALARIAREQRKIARSAGVTARNVRKLARIRAQNAQKAAQEARRGVGAGERTPSNVDRAQGPVQPAALRLPCPRHAGLVCPTTEQDFRGCQFGFTGVCPNDGQRGC